MKCSDQAKAIYCHTNLGPTFGTTDIHICGYSNVMNSSYSDISNIYKHPQYAKGSNEAKSFLAGSCNFQTSEIEVYTKE